MTIVEREGEAPYGPGDPYIYACQTHASLRNSLTKDDAEMYSTAYEQLDRPLLHIVQTGRFCMLINPGQSSVKCNGPIFRWKTSIHPAPRPGDSDSPS